MELRLLHLILCPDVFIELLYKQRKHHHTRQPNDYRPADGEGRVAQAHTELHAAAEVLILFRTTAVVLLRPLALKCLPLLLSHLGLVLVQRALARLVLRLIVDLPELPYVKGLILMHLRVEVHISPDSATV